MLAKIIDHLGPATIQPLVASTSVAPKLRRDITTIVTNMHQDPAIRPQLQKFLVGRWAAVHDAAYDDIRAMVKAAEEVGFYVLQ